MYSFWSFFIQKSRFTTMVLITIVFLGSSAIVGIPKESTPSVDVPIAVVSTVLPGGAPEDVERLVTNVLEVPLRSGLSDVNSITSESGNGFSSITIEFNASADIGASLQDVRDIVDQYKSDLPDDATEPRVIQVDFANDPVVTVSLSSSLPEEVLYGKAEEVADILESIPGVSSVSVSGLEDREVTVVVNADALQYRNLTVSDVVRGISRSNVAAPIGNLEDNGVLFSVRLAGDIRDSSLISDIPFTSIGGTPVYVRDVATVVDARALPKKIARTSVAGGVANPSVALEVFKSSSANVTQVSTVVSEALARMQEDGELLSDVAVTTIYDSGKLLKDDLNTLTQSGIQTVLLVTFVLLIAVGWREALIAAISIPLSFLTAFIGLLYSGNTLNFVSLFALILSIGIIVDSTIVVVEGINRRMKALTKSADEDSETRHAIKESVALSVIRDFHAPLTAGTLTTVAVFAPLLIVSGVTGEFIKSIPFTVIFVLLSSLLVALGFIPLIATVLLRRATGAVHAFDQRRNMIIEKIEAWYRNILSRILRERETQNIFFTAITALFIISLLLPSLGAVRVVFFDNGDSDYVVVEITLPVGSTLEAVDTEVLRIEDVLYTVPEISSFVTTVGQTSAFSNPFASASGDTRFANIFINLRADRERTSLDIIDDLRARIAEVQTNADVRVTQLSDGPPSLAPITVTISGNDLNDLDVAAREVEMALKSIPFAAEVQSSVKDSASEFVLYVDRDEVAARGADVQEIALVLRSVLEGVDASTIKDIDGDIDIVVRLATKSPPGAFDSDPRKTERVTLNDLTGVHVKTTSGLYPIHTFVNSSVEKSRTSIRHEDGERIAVVSSFVASGGNALEITNQLRTMLESRPLPSSVSIRYGGESEDIDQSFRDMFVALILGILGMFAILVLQFNSFRYALYVLVIVPFSLIGVFAGLMITGNPLSFPSIMGFIALSGIVVNNSIILIDSIHQERRTYAGEKTLNEMIIDASVSRLRPVLLTALTTVIGVVPLLFVAAIWVPLAYALMFGLAFATVVTLVLVPAIYARWPGYSFR